mmetsp:Transcript_35108/g.60100  ORF Transcript_35108/g.60100 Transcript_35108/m.60100 type:complete len:501 (-) Transcript_35108:451-1953(-)
MRRAPLAGSGRPLTWGHCPGRTDAFPRPPALGARLFSLPRSAGEPGLDLLDDVVRQDGVRGHECLRLRPPRRQVGLRVLEKARVLLQALLVLGVLLGLLLQPLVDRLERRLRELLALAVLARPARVVEGAVLASKLRLLKPLLGRHGRRDHLGHVLLLHVELVERLQRRVVRLLSLLVVALLAQRVSVRQLPHRRAVAVAHLDAQVDHRHVAQLVAQLEQSALRGGARLRRRAHLVAEVDQSRHHRADVGLVVAAARADREAKVVLRDDPEDAEHASDVHRAALEQQGVGRAPFRLDHALVRVAVVDDGEESAHRREGVEVVEQRRVHLGLVRKQLLQELALGHHPRRRLGEPAVAKHRLDHAEVGLDPLLLLLGVLDRLLRVVHRPVPRLQQEHEPDLPGRVPRERLTDRDEVLERLGHLEPLDVQVAKVPKVVDPLGAPVHRFRLAELVVVVGELEVRAAGVHVHVVPHQIRRHHRALDVPPGPAASPRRVPRRLAAL